MMSDEIPLSNPPYSAVEASAVADLRAADLAEIDAAILANCARHWLKVARVVIDTWETLEPRFPSLTFVFYTHRIARLAAEGRLDSQGNIFQIRFSEIRLPGERRAGEPEDPTTPPLPLSLPFGANLSQPLIDHIVSEVHRARERHTDFVGVIAWHGVRIRSGEISGSRQSM